jgi:uncharacterized protein
MRRVAIHLARYTSLCLYAMLRYVEDNDEMQDDKPDKLKVLRPLPVITSDTAAFWTGGSVGELRIYRCQRCAYYIHPPVRFCPKCESRDVKPEPVSGYATVETFSINHKEWVPGLQTPYVLALVELDEQLGLRLPTNIIGCRHDQVRSGLAVRVEFERCDDVWVPLFSPRPNQ